jgi:hypothetical protein
MVMGAVELPPQLKRVPFAALGLHSNLDQAVDGEGCLPGFACATGNLSILKADLLRVGLFDETFRNYGWEDSDFGYRAAQAGLRLLYNPRAVSFHHDHAITLKLHGERMRRAAQLAWILFKKHPDLARQMTMFRDKGYIAWHDDPPNIILRKAARTVMSLAPALKTLEGVTRAVEAMWPSPTLLRPLYRWIIGTYICIGYREGLKTRYG